MNVNVSQMAQFSGHNIFPPIFPAKQKEIRAEDEKETLASEWLECQKEQLSS